MPTRAVRGGIRVGRSYRPVGRPPIHTCDFRRSPIVVAVPFVLLTVVARMPEGLSVRSHLRADVLLACTCLVTYLAADVWAKSFSLPGSILIWFPPAGVAIGFCYLRVRLVAVVFVAELIATTWITGLAGEFGIVGLVVNSAGIAAAYGIAGWSLRKLRVDPRLGTPEDLLRLSFAWLVVGPVTAAVVGLGVQGRVGLIAWSEFGRSGWIFWLGDALASGTDPDAFGGRGDRKRVIGPGNFDPRVHRHAPWGRHLFRGIWGRSRRMLA